jgi:hypothetical protein
VNASCVPLYPWPTPGEHGSENARHGNVHLIY